MFWTSIAGGLVGNLRRLAVAAVTAMALSTLPASADVEKRVALVIGNDNYIKAPHLDNPVYDAKAISEKLRRLNFDVVEGYNLDEAHMRTVIGDFADRVNVANVAIVYYAGHGMTFDNENYLLPIDLDLRRPVDLDLHSLTVSSILKQMRSDERISVVILDACRDNLFPRDLAKAGRAFSARGLAAMDKARGALIAYSTDPLSAALDGPKGEHSPFAAALLDHLDDSDVTVEDLMSRVRREVDAKTHHEQTPWVNTSLLGEFKFNPTTAASAPATPTPAVVATTAPIATPAPEASQPSAAPTPVASRPASPTPTEVAALPPPDAAAPVVRPDSVAPAPDLRSEIGTPDLEKSLNLNAAAVKRLQVRLSLIKIYHGPLNGDIDDAATRDAITEWQNLEGVRPTGSLGPRQFDALMSIAPPKPQTAALLAEVGTVITQNALALTPDDIKDIQLRLFASGYAKSQPSGKFDPATNEAISRWQKDAGVPATGKLGPLQLEEMRAETETRYEAMLESNGAPEAPQPGRSAPPRYYGYHPQVHQHHNYYYHPGPAFNPVPFFFGGLIR